MQVIELHNSHLSITVNTRGGELLSIRSLSKGIGLLWQGDKAFWGRRAPVLFPIVGRLKDDEYFFKGNSYQLNQHGFARDLDFEVAEQHPDSISLLLTSDEFTRSKFPFDFELYISYRLVGAKVTTSYQVKNIGIGDMWFSIGGHPAYRCPIFEGERFEDYSLYFNKESDLCRYLLSGGLISDKTEQIALKGNELPLNYELFEKDALVLKGLQSDKIDLLNKQGKGLSFLFKGFPFFGIWTAKAGAPFICLEPWHGIADLTGHSKQLEDKAGIIKLPAEKAFQCEYELELKL